MLTEELLDDGSWRTVEETSHEISDDSPIALCDRSAQKQAKRNVTSSDTTAGKYGTEASQVGGSIIPGLEREAQNPVGFTPEQRNDQLVSGAEAVGGVNSGVRGAADLARARTRTAGGFTPALDEAARVKGRQLASNALEVSGEDARLAQQKQQFAQSQLAGIRSQDITAQLKAMGLSDEAIQAELAAGQQGWFQDAMFGINTLSNAGRSAARAYGDLGLAG